MTKYKAVDLVEDFDLYPRLAVDPVHVNTLVLALQAGDELPPIIIEKKSKRIVDGFHRRRAHLRAYGNMAEVVVIEKVYSNDKEMFLDCVRLNAGPSRARPFATGDQARVISYAERFHVDDITVARALHITVDRVSEIKTTRLGRPSARRHVSSGEAAAVPLKRTVQHLAGKVITQQQIDAQAKLSGMPPSRIVNELILLIETPGFIEQEDDKLMAKLRRLAELLEELLAESANGV